MNSTPKKISFNTTADTLMGINQADIKADAQIKKVLACKPVLAVILKETVAECQDMELLTIENCIGEDPKVLQVPVAPMNDKIVGQSQEDFLEGEGFVRYDIRTSLHLPGDDNATLIKIIVDVEAQLDDKPGYDIPLRALFYCSRLVSSQLGTEFSNKKDDPKQYGNIKKVYSIWICSNTAEKRANSVDKYSIDRKTIMGANNDDPRYDIMTAVIINIGKNHNAAGTNSNMLQALNVLLDTTMSASDKIAELPKYGVRMTREVKEEVNTMSTYSAEILERGIDQGIEIGRDQGIEIGRDQGIEIGRDQGIEASIIKLLSKGNAPKFISENLDVPLNYVIKLAKDNNIPV